MFNDIINMCPMYGNAEGVCNPGETEDLIDRALVKMMESQTDPYNRGIIRATYSAYISMTMSGCEWDAIRFMFSAMNEHI